MDSLSADIPTRKRPADRKWHLPNWGIKREQNPLMGFVG
jgi:hypothetical protein